MAADHDISLGKAILLKRGSMLAALRTIAKKPLPRQP
jgi:hypothetical protein